MFPPDIFLSALAADNAITRGRYADHEQIAEALLSCFPSSVLQELNLDFDVKSDTNWLRTIFRKHRKSFSALQHLMVWQALKLRATVAETLEQVKNMRVAPVRPIVKQNTKGKADIYPRFVPAMEWNTAAADVVVRESGKQVLTYEEDLPLTYNKPNLLNPFFIVS